MDSFIHDEDDDEAALVQLTERVQFFNSTLINHVQSSINESIVEPKPKMIRLIDLIDYYHEGLIKARIYTVVIARRIGPMLRKMGDSDDVKALGNLNT